MKEKNKNYKNKKNKKDNSNSNDNKGRIKSNSSNNNNKIRGKFNKKNSFKNIKNNIFLEADNVIITKKGVFTKNLTPNVKVYDEETKFFDNIEYRFWNPYKSKISAGLMKGLKLNLKKDKVKNVLYLGAASGTTISHLSDILTDSFIFSVEFSRNPFIDLFLLSKKRKNIIPFFEDAFKTHSYFKFIPKIDFLFMDIAQKNQVEILEKNLFFVDKNTQIVLALKAKSIDVTKKNKEIYFEVRKKLEKNFKILQELNLEPYEKDHKIYLLKKL